MTAGTMTANDLFAAAPELMKKWTTTSVAIAASLEPSLVRLVEIRELRTTALEIKDGKIAAIYVVRNPDKLRHLH
jgi:hypothetical protein